MSVTLIEPNPALLQSYAAALEKGWSPNTTRDVSQEQLNALRADADAFLKNLLSRNGAIDLGGGRIVPKLPGYLFWITDGEFCGSINFRHQPGTSELPPHCSGHIGYSIVPWKEGRGYATEALRQLLERLRGEGFTRVSLTCDTDNLASCRVIEKNGGQFTGRAPDLEKPGREKLVYWVELS